MRTGDFLMLEITFRPRFNDTDALGHINNASMVTWFEEARRPIFEIFIPDLDPKKWNMILARVEVDYVAQGYYQKETKVRTSVEKIGNSSIVLFHEAFQDEKVICRGKSFLVHYDYGTQKSVPIPAALKEKISKL